MAFNSLKFCNILSCHVLNVNLLSWLQTVDLDGHLVVWFFYANYSYDSLTINKHMNVGSKCVKCKIHVIFVID